MSRSIIVAIRRAGLATGALLLTISALFSNLTFERATYGLQSPSREALELPPSWLASTLSLNYRTFAADILWVGTLVDYGESMRAGITPPFLLENGHVIADLDPRFRKVYDWFPNTAMTRNPFISEDEIQDVNRFLERGMVHFPSDAELPFTAAMNYIGYSGKVDNARRLRETEHAIAYLERALQLENAHETIPFVLSWFIDRRRRLLGLEQKSEPDREREIRMLSRALLTVDDEHLRARIRNKLERMNASESVVSAARQLEAEFAESRRASELEFLPADLWTAVTCP
jgi:hypothetical protein